VIDRCRLEVPPLREVPGYPGRRVACHRAEEVAEVPAETLRKAEGPIPLATQLSEPAAAPAAPS
jgi:hypothetical protein